MACPIYLRNKKIKPFDSIDDVQKFLHEYHPEHVIRIAKVRYEEIDAAYRYEAPCYVGVLIDNQGDLRVIDEDGSFFFAQFNSFEETLSELEKLFEYC